MCHTLYKVLKINIFSLTKDQITTGMYVLSANSTGLSAPLSFFRVFQLVVLVS